MEKIKQLSFVLFIFSALTFSFPADSSAFDLEVLQSFEEHLEREQHNNDVYYYLQRFFVDRRVDRHTHVVFETFNSCGAQGPRNGICANAYGYRNLQSIRQALTPPSGTNVDNTIDNFIQSNEQCQTNLKACLCESNIDLRILLNGIKCGPRQLLEGMYDRGNANNEDAYIYLQRFFVDRRVDRHTPIVRDAFNSCTGMNFTTQRLRQALTPTPGTNVDNTIDSFTRHIQPSNQNLKACLCESDIDERILERGLKCDPFILALRNEYDGLAKVDLEKVLKKQRQTKQMMSEISKILHDTAMSVIRKIGGS